VSLKRNVVANYLGQGWRALMSLAFVPIYIKYLGIEAYGLIGMFAILQGWLGLLDMGMKPALGREMARFTGGLHDTQYIRNLLRSIEVIGFMIAGVIALGLWAASPWLASEWLAPANLPVKVIASAIAVMGAVTALRFLEDIYASAIIGLQRQVLVNVVMSVMATIRGLGAIAVLIWVSRTIEGFFLWQGVISVITVALFAFLIYRTLPKWSGPVRFSWPVLHGIWRFSAGMMAITLLSLLLTQVDKILLSRLLSLRAFGYYALAGVVANALFMLATPITTAFYPRFTELATRGDQRALAETYHQAAQLVTVLMGSAAIVLFVFGEKVLLLWTRDAVLSRQVAPLLSVLALGTLFNGLMWIPYHTQLAHGWTSLTIKVNIVAVAIVVPAILLVVPKYGAIGAAWAWVALNLGYVVVDIYFMHQRLLPTEKWRWYTQDVVLPLMAAIAIALPFRFLIPDQLSTIASLAVVAAASICVLAAAAASAPLVRRRLAPRSPSGRVMTA
jgi:O-antigen/teichoic acid export membrane protein